ncbi:MULTISPECIES: BREX-1 system adenine-specific DNA-methyltransferase PglX [Heyndrickxia]|uniref:BREX-1 system adenine-specific DNA-methyltransferase PglX n=1 Tax=Heyndrickxia TaxID=2837504 RepID=UPI002DBF8389|nr:BREX-1 system adenine-specific DNA-methyltransferase PglX [Weizmannia sp. CD-2023]MEC2303580.1 BREX-1 system adenine-specific DNA-methyltransferase PglX [Weizmannia sp. CD-2023]MEC2340512.1 BREX-1 system adenine-specific DNA-methyltransferase PglX [Weizmannia sp. CD-2023]
MNKSALKTFATKARRELLKKVEARAMKIGITEDNIKKAEIESSDAIFIDGRQLSKEEKIQRNRLIDRVHEIGFKRVMEEVAYTWFNRFTALRFMEVNDYLPTKVRVLSSTYADSTEPDMMKEAFSLDLDIDKEYVYELKMNNQSEELFKYLIIKHCNDLNRYMPFMFETINDYTEILFPDGLLATDSFVRQMTNSEEIPEDNWKKVEIIGWLYQYYISEENERVIKAKKRYKAEELPFATQLFTPEWIVRYMVQNALGRYWIESHPEHRDLINDWEFYLENPNPEADYEEKLAPYINKELKVEDIKCFDPAMGSGHILVYMFDVLFEIYNKCGYMEHEIPRLIIENNLYGLDIDNRAYQLASFSLIMKALEYNKRLLRSIERDGLKMNLAAIQETNAVKEQELEFVAGEPYGEKFDKIKEFVYQFHNAKTIGSLIQLEITDIDFIQERLSIIECQQGNLFEEEMKERLLSLFKLLVKQTSIMKHRFDVLVTNPPYVGNKYLTPELSKYLDHHYHDVKTDLFSAFIEYSFHSTKKNGQMGFMSPYVWMFISSYEKLRENIIKNQTISSLIQLEYSGFDEATVPICTFTLRNYHSDTMGEFIKLSDFKGSANQPLKTLEAIKNPGVYYRYSARSNEFNKLPGSPISYWVSGNIKKLYENELIGEKYELKEGVGTRNDTEFLRMFWEVPINHIGLGKRWVLTDKAGYYKKWYMGFIYVMDWENDGERIKNYRNPDGSLKSRPQNLQYLFREGVSWGKIGSGKPSFRWRPKGFAFNDAAPTIFGENVYYLLAELNSNLFEKLLKIQGETLNITTGVVSNLPNLISNTKVRKEHLKIRIDECIKIAMDEWNYYETSIEFNKHPFLIFKKGKGTIEDSYMKWEIHNKLNIEITLKNEEELNQTFIQAYGLQEEIPEKVLDDDITLRRASEEMDIKSFISYAIGCSFGRYSLDDEGLVYAGGDFDPSRYETFPADKDNILPILPGPYFEDDIVSRFIEFVRITFGEDNLNENLDFVADALGRKKGETAKETLRRYFLNDFYKDHVQTYKKRPIYWLFTSGKEKAFNCLIYMHRYDKTTLSRIRTDYLHEYQIRLDAEKQDLLNIIDGDSTAKEVSNAKKQLKSLDKKIAELKQYDELLHHMADMQIEIDLDDGVKVNYEKFKGLLAKIY